MSNLLDWASQPMAVSIGGMGSKSCRRECLWAAPSSSPKKIPDFRKM